MIDGKALLGTILYLVDDFADQFEQTPGVVWLLREYTNDLARALTDGISRNKTRKLLKRADDILGMVSAECKKLDGVFGSHVRVAAADRLMKDVRVAIQEI